MVKKDGELWAITCYFNPAGYRRKLTNYRAFRRRLSIPLLSVELAYGPDSELSEDEADIFVRLRGKDVLWQKERLLNLAARALPRSCRKVVWLDCDVVFEAEDWHERTSFLLDRFGLVQPFSHAHRMPADWAPGDRRPSETELRSSIPFLIASGMPMAACLGATSEEMRSSPGYAWAASREFLEEHQLYDACVIGGADSTILRAAYGRFEDAVRFQYMNGRRREHYLAWANGFYDAVRAKVAFVPGDLFHLWHGDSEHRRYRERFAEFSRFQFDPFEDIAIDRGGAWRWNSDKPAMHEYVRDYFASRREDG